MYSPMCRAGGGQRGVSSAFPDLPHIASTLIFMTSSLSTWGWMRNTTFANLLALSDDCYPAGIESLKAAIVVAEKYNRELHLLQSVGVRIHAINELVDGVSTLLLSVSRWDVNGLERYALKNVAWHSELQGVHIETLLRVIILRGSDRLPLFNVMAILGRDEALRRIHNDLEAFRLSLLVG